MSRKLYKLSSESEPMEIITATVIFEDEENMVFQRDDEKRWLYAEKKSYMNRNPLWANTPLEAINKEIELRDRNIKICKETLEINIKHTQEIRDYRAKFLEEKKPY